MTTRDASALAEMAGMILSAATRNGRLTLALQACRPNWEAELLRRAAAALADGIRDRDAFRSTLEWLEHVELHLSSFASAAGIVPSVSAADAMAVKRWENRWRRYRSVSDRAGEPLAGQRVASPRRVA